jgi:tetratricopeptide (TPR) repeat protein
MTKTEMVIARKAEVAKSIDAAIWKIYIYRLQNDDRQADLATYELAKAWPDPKETFNAMYLLAENNFSSDSYQEVMKIFDNLYRKAKVTEHKSKILIGQAALSVFHKKYVAAQNYLEKLRKDDPQNQFQAKAAYLLGNITQAAGDYQGAIEHYKNALTLKPDTYLFNAAMGSLGDCYFILAGKKQQMELYAEALKSYREILKTSKLDTGLQIMTLYKIGRTIEMSEKDDEAIEYYNKAVYFLTSFGTPAARLWAAKAAEALFSIAEKRPLRQHIEYAANALNILEMQQIIPAGTAEKRTDHLRKVRFRPRIAK